jgi:NAD(P)-dependent dehydrogenase (short-subunit alcohol dehydrogenase family)
LLDNSYDKLNSLVQELNLPDERMYKLVIDLRDPQAVQSAAEAVSAKFGGVSALIHLVGGWVGGRTIPESSIADFEFMLSQHAWTTFHLFKSFAPLLAANGWGRVVTLSIPLSVHPAPEMGAYAAGKAAQEALVQTLAEEFKDQGVTANVIHVQSIDINNEGKGTSPAEIVATILHLFSDEAAKINGRKIPLF